MKKLFVVPLALAFNGVMLFAQQDSTRIQQLDEVVVSDSRFQLKRENSGKTVIKITAEELKRYQGRSVAEIINTKSGIEINGSRSVAGQNLGYFIRGGNNRQVLVLIDGAQINDPSQIANDFDLRLLDAGTIESIEMVKGAASTLYGNSAATAVISITTKGASKAKVALAASTVIGTNAAQEATAQTLAQVNNVVTMSGTLNKFSYALSFANQYTDGLSAAGGDNTEKDPFSRINTSLKLGYVFSKAFSVTVFGGHSKYNTDIDGFPAPLFLFADTRDRLRSEQYRAALSPKFDYTNGSLVVNAAYTKIDRETFSDFPSEFASEGYVVDVYNKYVFADRLHTIVGFNHQNNQTLFAEEVSYENNDPYANVVYVSEMGLQVNAGLRLNNHSAYGSQLTYNANPSFVIQTAKGYGKLMGSFSTSFIAPSLFQLFDPTFGNTDLQPEENRTLEAGFEWKRRGALRLSGLYFNRKEENTVLFTLIDPMNFVSQYQNAPEDATVHGVEIEVETEPIGNFQWSANYSFTELREGIRLRLPKHRANATVAYTFSKQTNASLNYQYVGSRIDTDFSTFENVRLDPYSLVDIHASHTFKNGRLRLFANVTNIFDTDFEEIIGFSTRGRNYSLGLNIKL